MVAVLFIKESYWDKDVSFGHTRQPLQYTVVVSRTICTARNCDQTRRLSETRLTDTQVGKITLQEQIKYAIAFNVLAPVINTE